MSSPAATELPWHRAAVFAEVIAVPHHSPDHVAASRRGARFQLSTQTPLRIGRSSRSRLQVAAPLGRDVLLSLDDRGEATLTPEGPAIVECAINGWPVDGDRTHALGDGDHLSFPSGLVLVIRSSSPTQARHLGLEAALAEAPDDADTLSVYLDHLEGHGDPLAQWLRSDRRAVEREQLKVLGALGSSARTLAVVPHFSKRGLLRRVDLARPAIVGPPGLFWHLEQLAALPVARALTALSIHYVEGAPARSVLAPPGAIGWPTSVSLEDIVPPTLELLRAAPFAATLEHLSFGTTASQVELPGRLVEAIAKTLPRWSQRPLVQHVRRASLEVLELPVSWSVFGLMPGHRLRLTAETRIGADERAHVLLTGPMAPSHACRIVRRPEGYVVHAEARPVAPTRLNGASTTHAVLRHDDVLEPVPGFALRVSLSD